MELGGIVRERVCDGRPGQGGKMNDDAHIKEKKRED